MVVGWISLNQVLLEKVPKFVWEDSKNTLLVLCLVVGPKVIKQLDHFPLKVPANLPEVHVLLDGVELVGELGSVRVHVGYHGADVADNGSDHHHAQDEVDSVEYVLDIWVMICISSKNGEMGLCLSGFRSRAFSIQRQDFLTLYRLRNLSDGCEGDS